MVYFYVSIPQKCSEGTQSKNGEANSNFLHMNISWKLFMIPVQMLDFMILYSYSSNLWAAEMQNVVITREYVMGYYTGVVYIQSHSIILFLSFDWYTGTFTCYICMLLVYASCCTYVLHLILWFSALSSLHLILDKKLLLMFWMDTAWAPLFFAAHGHVKPHVLNNKEMAFNYWKGVRDVIIVTVHHPLLLPECCTFLALQYPCNPLTFR